MDSDETGMNPVAMTVISPRKEYWPSRGSNQWKDSWASTGDRKPGDACWPRLEGQATAFPTESIRYEYKACLKLLISLRPYHSHTCNSLLPFPQCTRTVEATIKRATWPMPIIPPCPKPIDRWCCAIYRWLCRAL